MKKTKKKLPAVGVIAALLAASMMILSACGSTVQESAEETQQKAQLTPEAGTAETTGETQQVPDAGTAEKSEAGTGSSVAGETSIAGKATAQAAEKDGDGRSGSYMTREIWCRNGDARIYGVAYIPEGQEKSPLVIFSHELGNSHKTGIPYAERLAEAGYAVYTFDFRGGSVVESRSDGENVGMSVMTEVSDLEAVLTEAEGWDFVDPDQIFLLGGSQGAVVSAVTGCRNADRIAGMMLMYPPLTIPDDMRERFKTEDSIPEEFDMFGGWIHVGRNYASDVWDLDVYEELASYQGDVLLMHGDRDSSVDLSVSEKAAGIIPHCEFYTIAGGGHEFLGDQFEEAVGHILDYLQKHCGDDRDGQDADGAEKTSETKKESLSGNEKESMEDSTKETMAEDSTEDNMADQEMTMKIGDTEVAVEWADNEAVKALRELVKEEPLTIQMSMYGGFEQVGPIGQRLPASDSQTTTQSGDIVLYTGSQIVVFYGSNSWAYTRLGHITDQSAEDMKNLLGNGDVTITIGSR